MMPVTVRSHLWRNYGQVKHCPTYWESVAFSRRNVYTSRYRTNASDERENEIEQDILRQRADVESSSSVDRCDTGDPSIDLCTAPFEDVPSTSTETNDSIDDILEIDVSNSMPKTAIGEAYERGKWLVGLLVLQSSSSFVLDSYQDLIREHLVVTLFLTMLVGAGGNAGNQSAIKVIRGMATGAISPTFASLSRVMKQQISVAFILGASLSIAGWVRVYLTNGDILNSSAIALSLFLIVCTSVIVGTLLPFGLARAGQDPANAGTSIQVLMDVLGVLITCTCCHYVLDEFQRVVTL